MAFSTGGRHEEDARQWSPWAGPKLAIRYASPRLDVRFEPALTCPQFLHADMIRPLGSSHSDRCDKIDPHGEEHEAAKEVHAQAIADTVTTEMHACVHDSGGDIGPS